MAKGLFEIDSAAWQTVLQRDRVQGGKFVYVALTTGIYCRPSGPARHPHRRNAAIVESVAKAEFQRIEGLSPMGFCDTRRLARFKERLIEVTTACQRHS
jgi:AraC family transcriptional regulator of adaptative response/methylated-DNA-[protein]-cysteine methyltransferase